jgi:hypothetical protein
MALRRPKPDTPSRIYSPKYLQQMAQKCKPSQVDPFFTKTGSKVGLAWLKNDSTKRVFEARQAARLSDDFLLKPNDDFLDKVNINENDN